MSPRILALVACLQATMAMADPIMVAMGDLDGTDLAPYAGIWSVCVPGDEGGWTLAATVEENMVQEEGHWLLTQRTTRAQGGEVLSTTRFDLSTLAPRLMETRTATPDGKPVHIRYELTADGHSGFRTIGDEATELSGNVSSGWFNGSALGFVFAALDLDDGDIVRTNASMIGFDGTYDVIATVVGSESWTEGGAERQAWMVDVEWHHLESGDIYPAGPDNTGGRYWISIDPPPGSPLVVRYQTDTQLAESVPSGCHDEP